ncbi:MAG: TIGR00730 family Rossman fold protein [Acidiferrobacteraceae bacterium]|nr:TIGR00730 family Rossman fold protein [Acidiferrobacteraceae bacterium]|tara:strand:+ start:129 stop:704 length:576 start_codon:yes stop_codon:yes gene_type:complete
MRLVDTITVFCGSNTGNSRKYRDAAVNLGLLLAQRNIQLVYGGASVGLMGVLANSVLDNGGRVVGVIPDSFEDKEVVHRELTELHIVQSMHARKALMANLCQSFIALPGGIGTLEEAFEVVTWTRLGLHAKPLGLLNVAGYYDTLVAFLNEMASKGFSKNLFDDALFVSSGVTDLVNQLDIYNSKATYETF